MSSRIGRNNLSEIFRASTLRSIANHQRFLDDQRRMHGFRPSGPPIDYRGIQIGNFYEELPENIRTWSETSAIVSTMSGLFTFLYGSTFYAIYKIGSLRGRVNLGNKQKALLFMKITAFFGMSFCASLAGIVGAKSLEKRKK